MMYGDYLPDFIEMQEDRIERIMDERCLPNGMYKCPCGKIVKLDETQTLDSSPWATPYCGECVDEEVKRLTGNPDATLDDILGL